MEERMGRLEGRAVLVTGAASGIGRASALLFAQEGAKVVVMDRAKEVESTAAMVRNEGGEALVVLGDAGAEADVKAAVDATFATYGTVDGVYANAGISGVFAPLLEQTVEQWTEMLRVNLIGPFLAIKHAAPIMVKQGAGAIVCTASVAGLRSLGGDSGSPYGASKAGVINLVTTACQALTGTGVRINAVCPGLIETGMTRGVFERARARGTEDRIGQLNPQRRAGQPHEIAQAVCFLLSDDASYVNGHAIVVDGGLTSSAPFVVRRS
jgi:NAD(P)-dependent dehydrogenase (short-subunit alcohol dehydrogenase family)